MPVSASEATPNVRLYNLRDAAGMSQQDVADAVNRITGEWNVTANAVSRWERGINRPQPKFRRALAQVFGVSVAELGLTQPRELLDQEAA